MNWCFPGVISSKRASYLFITLLQLQTVSFSSLALQFQVYPDLVVALFFLACSAFLILTAFFIHNESADGVNVAKGLFLLIFLYFISMYAYYAIEAVKAYFSLLPFGRAVNVSISHLFYVNEFAHFRLSIQFLPILLWINSESK